MAGICSENLTIGVPSFRGAINVFKKKITGVHGEIYDDFLVHKNHRNCLFEPVGEIANGSEVVRTDSFAKMINEMKIDFHHKPFGLNWLSKVAKTHQIEMSTPISAYSLQVGQIRENPTNLEKLDLSSFLLENFPIIFLILIGYFFIIFCIFALSKLLKKNLKSFKLFTLDTLDSLGFKFLFLSLSFSIYTFICLNLLTNCIKTESVVFDTSQYIDSLSKLKNTHRTMIVTQDVLGFLSDRSNEVLSEIYHKKKEANEIFVIDDKVTIDALREMILSRVDSYFFLISKLHFYLLSSLILKPKHNKIIYLSPVKYYEEHMVWALRKTLDLGIKKSIHRRIYDTVEKGLYSNYEYKFEKMFESSHKKSRVRVYEKLEDLVDEFTQTSPFNLKNFKRIFIIYFVFILFLLIVFIAHHIAIIFIIPMHIPSRLKIFCKKIYTKIYRKIHKKILEKFYNQTPVIEISETVHIEY